MADVVSLSAQVAAVGQISDRTTRSNSTTASAGSAGSSSGSTQAAAPPLALSQGAIGATTGASLGAETMASVLGLQATGDATAATAATTTEDTATTENTATAATATTAGAAGGQGAATATATTTTEDTATTTTQETETTIENGQVVRVTRTIEIDADGVRTVVAESRRVVYGTTLASIAYQNAQALAGPSQGALLGIG